ncbi:hypothetical protein CANCADRAFT_534 [Tortispora caseinolytica NRRL Y-17796]|uniref:SCD domain-containing protein n=1 Tax=Tortispora caseinolytica NRRL Y-17796 TaxID=767744 RepID=A0A1E4TJL2_9ASCO|nr:hypothetical protein CANCADRAFT_534 [Tortispora caseinolytica NRRL Y-17796]
MSSVADVPIPMRKVVHTRSRDAIAVDMSGDNDDHTYGVKKRKTVHARVANDQIDESHPTPAPANNLIAALDATKRNWSSLLKNWINSDEDDRATTFANFLLLAAGCPYTGLIDSATTESSDLVEEQLEKARVHVQRKGLRSNPRYPASKLTDMGSHLVAQMYVTGKLDPESLIMDSVLTWLHAMCRSSVRQFRHVSTSVLLGILEKLAYYRSSLVSTTVNLQEKLESQTPNSASRSTASQQIADNEAIIDVLHKLIDDILHHAFTLRCRDVDPKIRAACLTSLGKCMTVDPSHILTAENIKYLAWGLSDPAREARKAAIEALEDAFSESSESIDLLELYSKSILRCAFDAGFNDIRIPAISLLSKIYTSSDLDPHSENYYFHLLFDDSESVRDATARAILSSNEQLMSVSDADDSIWRETFRLLSDIHEHIGSLTNRSAYALDETENIEIPVDTLLPSVSTLAMASLIKMSIDSFSWTSLIVDALTHTKEFLGTLSETPQEIYFLQIINGFIKVCTTHTALLERSGVANEDYTSAINLISKEQVTLHEYITHSSAKAVELANMLVLLPSNVLSSEEVAEIFPKICQMPISFENNTVYAAATHAILQMKSRAMTTSTGEAALGRLIESTVAWVLKVLEAVMDPDNVNGVHNALVRARYLSEIVDLKFVKDDLQLLQFALHYVHNSEDRNVNSLAIDIVGLMKYCLLWETARDVEKDGEVTDSSKELMRDMLAEIEENMGTLIKNVKEDKHAYPEWLAGWCGGIGKSIVSMLVLNNGYDMGYSSENLESLLIELYELVEAPALAISATNLRNKKKNKEDVPIQFRESTVTAANEALFSYGAMLEGAYKMNIVSIKVHERIFENIRTLGSAYAKTLQSVGL